MNGSGSMVSRAAATSDLGAGTGLPAAGRWADAQPAPAFAEPLRHARVSPEPARILMWLSKRRA